MTIMDYIKNSRLNITKVTLIAITIIGSIVNTISFCINRNQLYPNYERVFKDLEGQLIQKFVGIIFVTSIIFIILFSALFVFFIIKENFTGVLVITILMTISFMYGLYHTFIIEDIRQTVEDIILSIIEITFGFYFAFLIKDKTRPISIQMMDDMSRYSTFRVIKNFFYRSKCKMRSDHQINSKIILYLCSENLRFFSLFVIFFSIIVIFLRKFEIF